jgi:hypothetical protein
MSDRWEPPQRVRRAERLRNGVVVVAEYALSGHLIGKTYYYTSDERRLTRILQRHESARSQETSARRP